MAIKGRSNSLVFKMLKMKIPSSLEKALRSKQILDGNTEDT